MSQNDGNNSPLLAGQRFVRACGGLSAMVFVTLLVVLLALLFLKPDLQAWWDLLVSGNTITPPTPAPSRSLHTADPGLVEMWRLDDIFIPPSDLSSPALFMDNSIVYIHGVDPVLSLADGLTGAIRWEVPLEKPVFELSSSESLIFLISGWRVQAYSIASGVLIWEGEELQGHASHRLRVAESGVLLLLSIDDTGDMWKQVITTIDPNMGRVLGIEVRDVQTGAKLSLVRNDVEIWTAHRMLFALDPATGQVAWTTNIERRVWDLLMLSSDTLVILSGFPRSLRAHSVRDGELLWSFGEPIASNIALIDGHLMGITFDAGIVTLSPQDGHPTQVGQFHPTSIQASERHHLPWIIGGDEMIFVYFGDSQELIGLRIERD